MTSEAARTADAVTAARTAAAAGVGPPADAVRTANAARLRAMHSDPQPLILPNVWDPVSARSFAEAGFGALATSSSAVAATLGYRDGATPGDEMFAAIARIASSVSVPVTADVESGYGLSPAELVGRLVGCGVVGCNLEDSDPGTRALIDPDRQAEYLAAVRAEAGADLVINARVDVYVRPPAGVARGDGAAADAAEAADATVAGSQRTRRSPGPTLTWPPAPTVPTRSWHHRRRWPSSCTVSRAR